MHKTVYEEKHFIQKFLVTLSTRATSKSLRILFNAIFTSGNNEQTV